MDKTFRQAARFVVKHSRWVPVVGAAVYLVLWLVGEASRLTVGGGFVLVLFALALGIAGFVPLVSLGAIIAIPALQLLGVLYPPSANNWPIYMATGFVALVIAF